MAAPAQDSGRLPPLPLVTSGAGTHRRGARTVLVAPEKETCMLPRYAALSRQTRGFQAMTWLRVGGGALEEWKITYDELKLIADAVGSRRGWDFSRMRTKRDPVPWDYEEVVRRYLAPADRVLDIGTGGGERFLRLALHFGTGVGTDASPEMIQIARENAAGADLPEGRVSFEVMPGEALRFPEDSFDVVLLRHAPVVIDEIVRVLRPGGVFVTQGVGGRNMHTICAAFGVTAYGEPLGAASPAPSAADPPPHDRTEPAAAFEAAGCRVTVIARGEYDVRYYVQDVESLIFWLKALDLPRGFSIERHWRRVDQIIRDYTTPEGIETNEHRGLLVLRKE